jgi:hypothetical protein
MTTKYECYKNIIGSSFLLSELGQSEWTTNIHYKYADSMSNQNVSDQKVSNPPATEPSKDQSKSIDLNPLTPDELGSVLTVLARSRNLADPAGPITGLNNLLGLTFYMTGHVDYNPDTGIYSIGPKSTDQQKFIIDHLNKEYKEYLRNPKAIKEASYVTLLLVTSNDNSYNQFRKQLLSSFHKLADYYIYIIDTALDYYDKNINIRGGIQLADKELEYYERHRNSLEQSKDILLLLRDSKTFGDVAAILSNRNNLVYLFSTVNAAVYIVDDIEKAKTDAQYRDKVKRDFRYLYEEEVINNTKHPPLIQRTHFRGVKPEHYVPALIELAQQSVIFDKPRKEVYTILQKEAQSANLTIYSPYYWRNVAIGAGTGAAIGFGLYYILRYLFNSSKQKSKEPHEGEDEGEDEEESGSSLLKWLLPTTGALLGGYLGHTGSRYT